MNICKLKMNSPDTFLIYRNVSTFSRHLQPGVGPSSGLLSDCENRWIVCSSNWYGLICWARRHCGKTSTIFCDGRWRWRAAGPPCVSLSPGPSHQPPASKRQKDENCKKLLSYKSESSQTVTRNTQGIWKFLNLLLSNLFVDDLCGVGIVWLKVGIWDYELSGGEGAKKPILTLDIRRCIIMSGGHSVSGCGWGDGRYPAPGPATVWPVDSQSSILHIIHFIHWQLQCNRYNTAAGQTMQREET